MRRIAAALWFVALATGEAMAQSVVGYSCGGHESLSLGELSLSAELNLDGVLSPASNIPGFGTGAQWSISVGPDSGGHLVEFDYEFPANDLGQAPVLTHASFARGGLLAKGSRDKAFFFVTLDSGEHLMAPPSPYDLQTRDKTFLAALAKSSVIAFDIVAGDGSPLSHNILSISEEGRRQAATALSALAAKSREKMQDYSRRCGPITMEWDPA